MSELLRELRYGMRALRASPGFTLLAILTLALGIGPNTAIFSGLNEMLLRPVPHVSESERLVLLRRAERGEETSGFSHAGYKDYRDQNTVFAGLMAFRGADLALAATSGRPESIEGLLVTGNYFSVLGIGASHGRLIGPEDDLVPGGHPVAVVSDSLWTRRFGRDPQFAGKSVRLNGFQFTVIGVAPPEFRGTEWGSRVDIWLPLAMERQARPLFPSLNDRVFATLDVIGRLKSGVTSGQAQAELDIIAARVEEPKHGVRPRVVVSTGIRMPPEWRSFVTGFISVLMATVSLVLVVACANLASLTLARNTRRYSEIAVRRALGAGRGVLVRQCLIESLLLSLPAGALGVAFAVWLNGLFAPMFGEWGTRETVHGTDRVVLAYTLGVSILASLAFGIAPALTASRYDLVSGLKGVSAANRPRRSSLRSALIVTQVAVSLVAIVIAALFVRTLHNLQVVDPGYDPRDVFFLQVKLRPLGYSEARGRQFYEELIERVGSVPGVRAVTLANSMPPGWMWGGQIEVEGRPLHSGERPLQVGKNTVAAGYFETVGAAVVAGRGIRASDTKSSVRVAVVNETMARQLWPPASAVGKRFRFTSAFGPGPWIEVVGVTRDGKYEYLGEPAQPHVSIPFSQNYDPDMKLVVRATDLSLVMPAVTQEVLRFDHNLPAPYVRTASEHLAESLVHDRVSASAISLSGVLAVLLAAIGLYGIVSFAVAQRTHEIGIRIALGATHTDVVRPLMSEGLWLTALGVAAGIPFGLGAARLLASGLYGVGAADAVSFVGGVALLAFVALLACWLPARRASRVDPVEALRCE